MTAGNIKRSVKRIMAGAGALVIAIGFFFSGLLFSPVTVKAGSGRGKEHVSWPLTWELDHTNINGKTYTEKNDESVEFGDGFIKFTSKGKKPDGEEEKYEVEYTFKMPQVMSVCNESEEGILFHCYITDEKKYYSRNFRVFYELVFIGENTGGDFGSGGFKINTEERYPIDFTMKCNNVTQGTLDMWKSCYLKNGALRSEELCREFEDGLRLRIIVDPYEFFELDDKNAYVMYSYKMHLGDVSFLEPMVSEEVQEEEEDPWIEEEDTVVAGSSEGTDEGSGIDKEIVEGEDKDKDNDNSTEESYTDDTDTDPPPWLSGNYDDSIYDDEEQAKNIGVSIGGAVVAAGAAAAGGGGAVAAKKASEDAQKEKEKQKKKKKEKYKMYVSKDFGDTLDPTMPPKTVYAKIVQVLDTGGEKPRADLTSRIKVSSKDGSLVVKDGVSDLNGKAALVSVPDKSNSSRGIVTFRFEGEGGAYTKNVVFAIANPEIRYAQDAIAFIARKKETAQMRFAVRGLSKNPKFSIKCQDGIEKCFKLSEVFPVEPGIWAIDITETGTQEQFAGYFESFDVEVTATDPTPIVTAPGTAGQVPSDLTSATPAQGVSAVEHRSAKETFQIVRFEEGIRVKVNDLKAYLVVKGTEDLTKTENPHLSSDCEKTPAHSRIEVNLYSWDEEKKCLSNPVPEKIEVYIEDVAGTAEEVKLI